MARLAQLVVVKLDQRRDGVVDGRQLHQRHLTVLREELEALHVEPGVDEGLLEVGLFHGGRDVREVESRGRRVDVGVVLRSGLFEAMQVRGRVVLGQSCVRLPVLRELNRGVLARHDPDLLAPQLDFVEVSHGLKRSKRGSVKHLREQQMRNFNIPHKKGPKPFKGTAAIVSITVSNK